MSTTMYRILSYHDARDSCRSNYKYLKFFQMERIMLISHHPSVPDLTEILIAYMRQNFDVVAERSDRR